MLSVWSLMREDRLMREDLLRQAVTLAQTLPTDRIESVKRAMADGDTNSRPYRWLRQQLVAVTHVEPAWRWVYLMNLDDQGQVVFLADSESDDSNLATQPGSIYHEASDKILAAFDRRTPAVVGPIRDRWGAWITALAPVYVGNDRRFVAMLGVDVALTEWRKMTREAVFGPASATGAMLLVLLVAACLQRLAQRQQKQRQGLLHHVHPEILTTAALGFCLTCLALWIAVTIERQHKYEAFTSVAHLNTLQAQRVFHRVEKVYLESLASYFASSQDVTPEDFATFVSHLADSASMTATLAWAPEVPADERERFRAASLPERGIWELDDTGEMRPAGERNRYYPVQYMLALQSTTDSGSQPDTGFDLASIPEVASLLREPWGKCSRATPLLRFSRGNASWNRIVALRRVQSIHADGPSGLVMASIDPMDILKAMRASDFSSELQLPIGMFELLPNAPSMPLGEDAAYPSMGSWSFSRANRRWNFTRPILAFDRAYALMAKPTPAFMQRHSSYLGPIVLLTGLLLTGAMTLLVHILSRKRFILEEKVADRTATLTASLQRYRSLAESMRDVVWTLDAETMRFLYISPAIWQQRGFSPEEKLSDTIDESFPPENRREMLGRIRSRADALKAGRIGSESFFTEEVEVICKDGSLLRTEMITSYWLNPDTGQVEVHGITRDITERKRLEKFRGMIEHSLQILGKPEDLDQVLRILAETLRRESDFAGVGIRLRSLNGYPFVAFDGQSELDKPCTKDLIVRNDLDTPVCDEDGDIQLQCLCGLVLGGKTHPDISLFTGSGSLWTADSSELLLAPGLKDASCECIHNGYRTLAMIPIRNQGGIQGLLQFVDRRKGQLTLETVQVLEDIASHIGEAIYRRRMERDYRLLFKEMLEGVAVYEVLLDERGHPFDFRYLTVNPAFERLSGRPATDIVGGTLLEVHAAPQTRTLEEFVRVATTGIPASFEYYDSTAEKFIEAVAFRPATHQIAAVFSDITDRKNSETELRESRRQFEALLTNLPGMAYRCQFDRDWTMQFVSAGSEILTGYEPRDLIDNRTLSYNDLIVPRYREFLWDLWQKAVANHDHVDVEYEIRTRNGRLKWVLERGAGVYDENGVVMALEGFVMDITDRKLAEFERERLARAIEQSTDSVIVTDRKGVITYVNPAFTAISGYRREEALGRNPKFLGSGKHDREFFRAMWQTITSGQTWRGQIVNMRKDNTLFTEQTTITPTFDATGNIVEFVSVKRDITDQLRENEQRESLQQQLFQSQKMESIGRLAGGVAHDFNNMLQAILGYTEMALEQVKPDSPLHSDLSGIRTTARKSAILIRQLQSFSSKQPASPRPMDLNRTVGGMIGMLRRLIGGAVDVEWRPASKSAMITADATQIDQIVTNLCVNARDAINGSGKIVLKTEFARLDKTMRDMIGIPPPGDYVVLSVQDSGCGIDSEKMAHIFEPFFTTKRAHGGTGLGLSTLYGIVQQLGGGIRVKSQPGQGSTFSLYLPCLACNTQQIESTKQPAEKPRTQRHLNATIMVVDDEPTILLTTQRILESLGYKVISTSSPESALEQIQRLDVKFDLLLTDVVMPNISGTDLVLSLRKQRPNARYLYMSGYAASGIANAEALANEQFFLHKPFTRDTLAKKIQEVLNLSPPSSLANG